MYQSYIVQFSLYDCNKFSLIYFEKPLIKDTAATIESEGKWYNTETINRAHFEQLLLKGKVEGEIINQMILWLLLKGRGEGETINRGYWR